MQSTHFKQENMPGEVFLTASQDGDGSCHHLSKEMSTSFSIVKSLFLPFVINK
jgi:hypothetical protein